MERTTWFLLAGLVVLAGVQLWGRAFPALFEKIRLAWLLLLTAEAAALGLPLAGLGLTVTRSNLYQPYALGLALAALAGAVGLFVWCGKSWQAWRRKRKM